jgi:FkbM family methyltransferase
MAGCRSSAKSVDSTFHRVLQVEQPIMSDPASFHPERTIPRVSYAQNREDILLDRLFGDHVGRYMDVGSCHPLVDSNTRFFYERGWRGVNLEPSLSAFQAFVDERPEDLNLNLAASDFDGALTFYEVGEQGASGISTLSTEIAQGYRQRGIAVVERQVPVRTIRSLIDTHGIEPPDFLSLDVENHEAAVIRGMPLDSWRPRVLVVESTLPLTTTPSYADWEPILLAQGYLFAAFNGVNRFYVREDLRDRIDRLATPVNILDGFATYEVVAHRQRAADLERRLTSERDRLAVERQRCEDLHQARQRDHAGWEEERRATDRERTDWHARVTEFEAERADWHARVAEFEAERADWHARVAEFRAERADWHARVAEFAAERADWQARVADLEAQRAESMRRRMAIEQHCDRLQAQLEATQRQLRPYRLLDSLGVVTVGYGWARKCKHRLVS